MRHAAMGIALVTLLTGCGTAILAPDPPTDVFALEGKSSGTVHLYYTSGSNVDEIRVYQGRERSRLSLASEGIEPTSATTITGLENGTTYYFALTAVRYDSESGLSEAVSARPVPHPCWDKMQEQDTPEEIDPYDSSDYHSHTWWYWSRGWSITFTWGTYVAWCDISTYSFEPIP
jgi:hypothetical protein